MNKLKDKDIEKLDSILVKCNSVQLVLIIKMINDKLYDKLKG